jgi:flagellar motor switch protein FliM
MGKILSQQEIDLILGHARNADKATAPSKFVQPWNPRGSGQMHNDQARAITTLHESFARTLSDSLGAYLRAPFDVSLISVEQLTFSEFLGGIPELTYLLALELNPSGVMAALQIDHSIVFPTVDVLLGGSGAYIEIKREISEIEEEIMEGVAKIITRELAIGWAPMGFEITLGERHSTPQIQRFLPPQEKVLALSFEVTLNAIKGTMNLMFPATVSNTMLRKLSLDWEYKRPKASAVASARLRDHLEGCDFKVLLGFSGVKVRVRNLVDARPGAVLRFNIPESSPASLIISERPLFDAGPVRLGSNRAAQLMERSTQLPSRKTRMKVQ